jgi:competence protein ComEC
MTSRSLGHRAPLLWLVFPLIAGIAAGKVGVVAPAAWVLGAALIAAGVAMWASWRSPRWWAPALVTAMILAGHASYTFSRARLPSWDTLPVREMRAGLRIDRVFPQTDGRRATGLATLVRVDDHLRELAGQRIYFSLSLRKGEKSPVRGAVVSAVGVLETVALNPPADSFDGYLAGAGINFRLKRGQIVATESEAPRYYRFCAAATERFKKILGLGIEEKRPALAGLLRAMMLGETHELGAV